MCLCLVFVFGFIHNVWSAFVCSFCFCCDFVYLFSYLRLACCFLFFVFRLAFLAVVVRSVRVIKFVCVLTGRPLVVLLYVGERGMGFH